VTLCWKQISDTLLGLGFYILGTLVASAVNMLSIRNQKLKLPLIPAMTWGMTYGAIFMAIIAMAQGKNFSFDYTFAYISSLLYLSIFGSVIAFASYLTLLNRIGAHKASYA
jgi:drug/metabolite transporter (DMT)-like permease